MARALMRYCAMPSCPAKVEPPATHCDQHQQLTRQHERRHHTGVLGVNYGRRWRRARLLFLGMNPCA